MRSIPIHNDIKRPRRGSLFLPSLSMLTPQEKIDEIYRILSRQESRRRWALFFTWLWRIVIITSIAIVVLYPGKTTEWMFRIAAPMIEQVVRQVIDTQKNSLTE